MAANARPPRRKTSRPVTRRVAGRPYPGSGPADSNQNPADGNQKPADGNAAEIVDDGNQNPADSNREAADGNQEVADSNPEVADSNAAEIVDDGQWTDIDAQSAETDAQSTETDAQSAETDAQSTETDAQSTETDAQSTDVIATTKLSGKTRPVARVSTLRPGHEAPIRPVADMTAVGPARPGRAQPVVRNIVLYVLGAVAAVLAVFALVAGLHPGATIGPNKAFIDQTGTTELTAQASAKLCQANSADATTEQAFDTWSAKTKTVLTGKALEQFDQLIKAQKDALTQAKAKNDCRMDALGVQNMSGSDDGATAQLVATMIVSGSQSGIATQSISPRYQVNMVKRGDQWLIAEVLDL